VYLIIGGPSTIFSFFENEV